MYLSVLNCNRHVASYYQHFALLFNKQPKKKCQQDDYTFTFHCTSEEQLHCNPIKKNCCNRELKIQGGSLEKTPIAFLQIVQTLFLKHSGNF